MGNKLSCSCAPLIRKAYRYEDSPWQGARRRDGHLLRLWAEVFHVSASGAGTVKWQQVSEDLVPVNITCIQDQPECVFHITAYNSQVDKILDVRLVQPGTRIGQASECFVYWKDPMTNDTWGLNFTSPIDAKQFRECCVSIRGPRCRSMASAPLSRNASGSAHSSNAPSRAPSRAQSTTHSPSFKFSRKASSSYSLKLEPPNKQKVKVKRKPVSTPASPSRAREPQCTCMTPEQYARLRAQDPRYRASSTLPRAQTRSLDEGTGSKVAAATSSTSLYDNMGASTSGAQGHQGALQVGQQGTLRGQGGQVAGQQGGQTAGQQGQPVPAARASTETTTTAQVGAQATPGKVEQGSKSEGTQVGESELTSGKPRHHHILQATKSMDYQDSADLVREAELRAAQHNMAYNNNNNNNNNINNNFQSMRRSAAANKMSKSTDDMRAQEVCLGNLGVDSNTLKRMLKPMTSHESPATSPEMTRRRYNHYNHHNHFNNNTMDPRRPPPRFSASRSSHEIGRGGYPQNRGLYLDLERNGPPGMVSVGVGPGQGMGGDISPPSDNVLFDNQCYATTPSSSNGNSDMENPPGSQSHSGPRRPGHHNGPNGGGNNSGSPTSRLLLEYEMHLRNTLAKGMDAESYSLHTFEALLSQSMENLEFAESLPGVNSRSPYPSRRRKHPYGPGSAASINKCSTLPAHLSHRLSVERPGSSREGYYSDRNELARERERERERERGYLSDHNSSSRCASCLGESARAQWFRHSDGWRSGSSAYGSGTSSTMTSTLGPPQHHMSLQRGHRRSPWDSLPSLRHDSNDSSYKGSSFDQRSMLDRQDSLRSDYLSDRDTRYGIVQQASIESTDSRLCYLTSSEISDDDRMSLTTAVSDDDDGESAHNSPYRAKQTGTAAASFNCTGAVRKAGFLSVKKWLLRKKHQIELARKRGWKGYWVCLKGTTLLFYPCDSREGRSVEAAPKHLIIVDGAIMQPIPEHPKRDYIFCLSTAFGDAYLFQAPCQIELENWVNSIHSACAAAFARHRGKTGTLHLLQEEIFRLEKAIESDHKLKHMADLQQCVVSDPETRAQLSNQIMQWEENVERLHCEQFRLRCYMASLQNGELPNPKSLLTHVSRGTKTTLNKLGVFTVSSFHAFICARSPSLLNNLLAGRGATKRRPPVLSRSNSGSSRRSLQVGSREENERTVKVSLPEGQFAHVYLREGMTVEEFLASACGRKNLNAMEHFVRVKKRRDMEDHNYFVPHRNDPIETYLHTHEVVEVCAKILYQVELQRKSLDQMWGFSVEAELMENADRQDELCCYVSRVEDKSVAMHSGIIKSDEIMVINGAIVSDLDMMYLESVLQEEQSLCMMMRSSRTEPPDLATIMRATDDIIDSLVCPPPPSEPPVISEEMISGLIVPAPGWSKEMYSPDGDVSPLPPGMESQGKVASRANSFEIENLLKTAEQVTGFCRSPVEARKCSPTGSMSMAAQAHAQVLLAPTGRMLTDAEKLRKVVLELVETERTYVKHLNNLLENYLEPLKKETFLSLAEINALFGNIQEIVTFQRQFLHNLDEAIEMEPDFLKFDHPNQFKNVLFSVGSAFLYYVNHFKLYSSFCASHSKAQKVLHPNEGNQALREFLATRNPRQQHSSTLESYLIKPIQRILKYPLLLQQLRNLTDPQSEQHVHLVEALKGMEKVAEHINEMQRIHEEYGAIFDHLFRQHQKSCKQPIDLSPGDLLYYGGVEWLNISDFLGKIKKGLELHAMCFVFKSAVVFLCKERLRQKKKLIGVSSKGSSSEVEIIRYQVLIPVTEVQVRASSAKDMDSHFLWELIHLRSQVQRRSEKVYVLSNSTAEFRNAFLKTIRQIIRESVRNMSLPAVKPGSGDSVPDDKGTALAAGLRTAKAVSGAACASGALILAGSQTLGKTKRGGKNAQRHSAGNIDLDSVDSDSTPLAAAPAQSGQFRGRSKTVSDAHEEHHPGDRGKGEGDVGTKSEGEDELHAVAPAAAAAAKGKAGTLGRTPNHLTLSTTSTLSAGSTGSQARLIQSSQHPENYQPPLVKDLGSPVWKPRDMVGFGESTTLPRKSKPSTSSDGARVVYEEFPSATLRSTRSHK
ncbi:protein still life, isoform SIF type 1 isoform X3 [Thrips palmi]|uniref:Protein still life, isoform SIF type 1 isoform X3 n=1 Tax=Thrips palmi TaxID=161013 RepID=A0A6P8YLB7_THRPL|nr:protein still life, isoform SIF type 1 isoform X3 [Thrips palmi]